MPGDVHEIRDPIHVFVRLDSDERRVLDSAPFQRLRHIHQLALTYLVYPGATHKRFEHSLGVMELADRVFDIVTHPNNLTDEIRDLLTPLRSSKQLSYWRQVAGEAIFEALGTHFDPDDFRHDRYTQKGGAPDFPVLIDDRTTLSSLAVSSVLTHLPIISVDYVFVERSVEDKARTWLENHRQDVVKSFEGEGPDG